MFSAHWTSLQFVYSCVRFPLHPFPAVNLVLHPTTKQERFKRVARNGWFHVDILTRELATSSEILISNHFHKLRISIQAYAWARQKKTPYGKRVDFSHLTRLVDGNAISQFKQISCHFSSSFCSLLWISCNWISLSKDEWKNSIGIQRRTHKHTHSQGVWRPSASWLIPPDKDIANFVN